jgi:phthalate 4,5-cis-dihydrodiol dehydrogenase
MRTTLVPHLAQLEGFEVEVCVDLDQEAARRVQHIIRARRWASRQEDVDTDCIDAAIIALPANVSYQVTSSLIERGISCFVEKPPAATTEEINALLHLAQAMKVNVQVGFNFRFAEAVVAFSRCVAECSNGPCTAAFEFRSKHPSGPEWGREDPEAAWLYHNGIHALDLLLWIVGDVQQVHAHRTRTREGKFTITALVEHCNNSVSTLELGTLTEKFDLRATLNTSDGHRLYMPHLGEAVMLTRQGRIGGEVLYRTGNLDNGWARAGYGPELQHFLQNPGKSLQASPSLLDALKASQLCDAMMNSLITGTIAPICSTPIASNIAS